MINDLTQQLSHGNNLTIDQMANVMNEILSGTQNDQDIANFLKNFLFAIKQLKKDLSLLLQDPNPYGLPPNRLLRTIFSIIGTPIGFAGIVQLNIMASKIILFYG